MPITTNTTREYCGDAHCVPCNTRRQESMQREIDRINTALRGFATSTSEATLNLSDFASTYTQEPPAQEEMTMLWCFICDVRFPSDQISVCSTCMESMCGTCAARHNHNGDRCDDCGYRTLRGTMMTRCDECDVDVCEAFHAVNHRGCRWGDYDSQDDGRYRGRPPVQGYGREASMHLIDAPYLHHPLAQGKRAAAIEIEAEFDDDNARDYDRLVLRDEVGICGDGSLSNGIEVTTPPAKGAVLVDIVTDTMQKMRIGGYRGEETCGMHTHIDLRDKVEDTRFMSHLFNAFFAIEDILYAMQSANRFNSSYSIPLRNSFKFFDTYGQKSGDFDYTIYGQPKTSDGHYTMQREKERKYATNRYMAFNFHSVYFRGSLECRLHEGSVDEYDALMWIDLLQTIIARVEKGHSYKMMRALASMNVTKDKVKRFARYFGLTLAQKAWVEKRIENGQRWGFMLPALLQWGTPVKGRPKRHEPTARAMRFINSRVECVRCSYRWTLGRRDYRCPGCDRRLVDDYGSMWYTRVYSSRRLNRRANIDPWNVGSAGFNFNITNDA